MSDGSGTPPTSQTKTTGGDKNCCPQQVHKKCKVKKLKVSITPKKRGDAPETEGAKGVGFIPKMKPAEAVTLTADDAVNRVKMPTKKLQDDVANAKRIQQQLDSGQIKKQTHSHQRAIARGDRAQDALSTASSPMSRWFDQEAIQLLQMHDLVIETIASFPMESSGAYAYGTAKPINTVDIAIEAETDGECPVAAHPVLSSRASTSTGGQVVQATVWPKGYPKARPDALAKVDKPGYDLQPATWNVGVKAFTLKDVTAAALLADAREAPNFIAGAVKFVKLGFSLIHPMDLEFKLSSCGKEDRQSFEPAELSALVRVYRDVQFAIGIKVPAFAKVERTVMANAGFKDKNELTMSDFAGYNKREVREYDPDPSKKLPTSVKMEDTKTFQIVVRVNELEINLTETYDKLKKLGALGKQGIAVTKEAMGHAKSVKEIGQIAGFGSPHFVIGLILLAGRLRDAWQKISEIKNAITDIIGRAPQLGFKYTWEMSFCEGLFEAGLGLGQGKPKDKTLTPEIDKRYVPTTWKFTLGVNIVILQVKAEVSFGLLVNIPVVGAIQARVVGQIVGSLELNGFKVEMQKGEDTNVTVGPSGKVHGRLYAVVGIEGWIVTYKKEIGIEAGFQVDLQWKWTSGKTESVLRIWTLPVQWYFTSVNSRTGATGTKLHTLFEPVLVFEAKDTHVRA